MNRAEELQKRLEQAQERFGYSPAQERLRRLRVGKTAPRTAEELIEWRAYVDNPSRVLRKITHDTIPKRGKVVATSGPREGEQVWWVDGVTYTDDPETVWVLAHKRVLIEDAPDGIPADYRERVEVEQRRRAEAERRRAERRKQGKRDGRKRSKTTAE
ncbi:hypothetical protein ACWGKS_26960 [Nocardiopsis sp. NPDC055879]